MTINPDKFNKIILDRTKSNLANIPFTTTDNQTIRTVPSAEFSVFLLDDKLNFNLHISNIFTSAANHLHALIRFKRYVNVNKQLHNSKR